MSLMSFCIIVCHRDPRGQRHKSWKVQNSCSVNWFLSLPALFPVCTTSEDVIKLKSLATIRHFVLFEDYVIIVLPISSSLPPSPSWLLIRRLEMNLQNKRKSPPFPGGAVVSWQHRNRDTDCSPGFQEKLSLRNCTRDLPISVYMQLDTSEKVVAVQSASRSFRQSYRRQSTSGGARPLLLYRQCGRRVVDV